MTWIQTRSGRAVDLLKPKADQIYMGDIVHALARINRFTGHTSVAYSVAVHSVHTYRLAQYLEPDNYDAHLAALLHDAPEAYTGDIGTPMQEALGLRAEDSLLRLITKRFEKLIFAQVGMSWCRVQSVWSIVKRADLLALQSERAMFMGPCERKWAVPRLDRWHVPVPTPVGPKAAEALFTRTLQAAFAARNGRKPSPLRRKSADERNGLLR